jgi:membrane-bound metal-dependent hydrolase YbcI (DUF457 family)
MAAFRTHVRAGLVVGYLGGMAAVMNQWINLQLTPLLMFVAAFVGSFLPDLDSDSGTPFDIVFDLFAFTGGCIVFYYCLQQTDMLLTYRLIIPPAVVIFIRYGLGSIFQKFTTHRGIFHSIPATLIGTLSTSALFRSFQLPVTDLTAIALSVGAGYLSHLILDEIYATVNFEGLKFRPKKSLGSALSLTGPSKKVTICAYVLLAALVAYNLPLIAQLLHTIR